jgi:hypothetical protein
LQTAYKEVEVLSKYYQGTGFPQSSMWTSAGLLGEEIEAKVTEAGRYLHLSYGFRSSVATSMVNFPSRCSVDLISDWSITFGTTETPANGGLTTRLVCITVECIRLEAKSWRIGETGEVSARACPVEGRWDDNQTIPKAPLCAMTALTFIETTRQKEIQAILKFGRDSA